MNPPPRSRRGTTALLAVLGGLLAGSVLAATPVLPSDRGEIFLLRSLATDAESAGAARLAKTVSRRKPPGDQDAERFPWDPDEGEMADHDRAVLPYLERSLETAFGGTYREGAALLDERIETALTRYEGMPRWVRVLLIAARDAGRALPAPKQKWTVYHTVFRGVLEFQDGLFGPASEAYQAGLKLTRLAAYRKDPDSAAATARRFCTTFLADERQLFADVTVPFALAALVRTADNTRDQDVRFRVLEGGLIALERGGTGRELFLAAGRGVLAALERLPPTQEGAVSERVRGLLRGAHHEFRFDLLRRFGSDRRRDELPDLYPRWSGRVTFEALLKAPFPDQRVARRALELATREEQTLPGYLRTCLEWIELRATTRARFYTACQTGKTWPAFRMPGGLRSRLEGLTADLRSHLSVTEARPETMARATREFLAGLRRVVADLEG